MERFVRYLVAGGVVAVVGLWLLALFWGRPAPRAVGVALTLAGLAALGRGIEFELHPPET